MDSFDVKRINSSFSPFSFLFLIQTILNLSLSLPFFVMFYFKQWWLWNKFGLKFIARIHIITFDKFHFRHIIHLTEIKIQFLCRKFFTLHTHTHKVFFLLKYKFLFYFCFKRRFFWCLSPYFNIVKLKNVPIFFFISVSVPIK